MDYNMMPVNYILNDQITKLNYTLIPPGFQGDVRTMRMMQENLSKLIDRLGEQSAAAQALNRVITTAEKLRNSPDHLLYLLKDSQAKGGNGELIGLLKVGRKHLFLFDDQDKVREVEPLCILDFFVLPDRQRHGYGKVLFDHMLNGLNTSANKLAIDGPSAKMEQFIRKNYGVERLIRQSNNFAVPPDFFSIVSESKSGRCTPVMTGAVGRFSAPKPQSIIGNVIHGDEYQEANNAQVTSRAPSPSVEVEPTAYTAEHLDTETNSVRSPSPMKMNNEDAAKADQEKLPNIQKSPERPSTLKVEPVSGNPAPALSPAGSTTSRRASQLTDRGYFDVKFYHNKLW
ncbi:alpha-tubulin N-acetyltransferase isoform X2 [Bicyclus anynana]|uniref:Alpha-tubulin N-acetyltransferase n=1 Tax=Bicyclus anynana TaxID=110368 RepID=A0A6J1N7T0_BICAN|nr:alpha-tubulin N-acetyltransferase isoform X2 [Bicyclus anynana]